MRPRQVEPTHQCRRHPLHSPTNESLLRSRHLKLIACGILRLCSSKVRNLVDARALRDHKAFPADLLQSQNFERPPKHVVEAAHKVIDRLDSTRGRRTSRSFRVSTITFLCRHELVHSNQDRFGVGLFPTNLLVYSR